MDVREKLVAFLYEADRNCNNKQCETCKHQSKRFFCKIHFYIDHLIANGVTVQEWIPVTERLPSDNGKYLCHIFDSSLNNLSFMAMVYYDRGNFISQSACVTDCVTHWMPLPQPPKGE